MKRTTRAERYSELPEFGTHFLQNAENRLKKSFSMFILMLVSGNFVEKQPEYISFLNLENVLHSSRKNELTVQLFTPGGTLVLSLDEVGASLSNSGSHLYCAHICSRAASGDNKRIIVLAFLSQIDE